MHRARPVTIEQGRQDLPAPRLFCIGQLGRRGRRDRRDIGQTRSQQVALRLFAKTYFEHADLARRVLVGIAFINENFRVFGRSVSNIQLG